MSELTHTRSCPAWRDMHGYNVNESDCTCGLQFRIQAQAAEARVKELERLAADISRDCNDTANERNDLRAQLSAAQKRHEQECSDADRICTALGIRDEKFRTEGGYLNAPHVIAHIRETLDALANSMQFGATMSDKYVAAQKDAERLRKEATDYMHAVSVLFKEQPEGDVLAERKPSKDVACYNAFIYLNDQGKLLRVAIDAAKEGANEEN